MKKKSRNIFLLGQLHTVHVRHLNVCHDYIGLEFLHHLKGFHAIISISDHPVRQEWGCFVKGLAMYIRACYNVLKEREIRKN